MEAGLRKAIDVPLYLAKYVDSVWKTLVQMTAVGNINCKSDLQVSSCIYIVCVDVVCLGCPVD